MKENYRIVEIETHPKRKQINWFNTFSNPCYSVTSKIDVTNVLNYSHKNNSSFFINFCFVCVKELQKIEEFRMRTVKEQIRIYDSINASVIATTKSGIYDNGTVKFDNSYHNFYKNAHIVVEGIKAQETVKETFEDDEYFSDFYISCLPWLNFESIGQALPDGNKEACSVPRLLWGKYYLENERYYLSLSITASHVFVDGKPMADAFNNIQRAIDRFNDYVEEI